MLLHHTRCGMQTLTDAGFADTLERETGERPSWSARTFEDLEEDVRDSIRWIRESPFIPRRNSVRGFVYEARPGGCGRFPKLEARPALTRAASAGCT